jgi:hypothetical protein
LSPDKHVQVTKRLGKAKAKHGLVGSIIPSQTYRRCGNPSLMTITRGVKSPAALVRLVGPPKFVGLGKQTGMCVRGTTRMVCWSVARQTALFRTFRPLRIPASSAAPYDQTGGSASRKPPTPGDAVDEADLGFDASERFSQGPRDSRYPHLRSDLRLPNPSSCYCQPCLPQSPSLTPSLRRLPN